MTDEEIIQLVNANTEELWSGEQGISKNNAFDMIKSAIKQQQETINEQAVAIAQKDAKIYAYEAIIANSNFKAIMAREGKK